MDVDALSTDDLIASFKIDLKEIKAQKYIVPSWINIYGC